MMRLASTGGEYRSSAAAQQAKTEIIFAGKENSPKMSGRTATVHTGNQGDLTTEMVGVSYRWTIKVLQVVGPKEMRAEVFTAYEEMVEDRTKKIYIGPPGSYLHPRKREWFAKPHDVWNKGVSTDGLVDGANMDYNDPLTVTGTKTYETTTGAGKTVFVLDPFVPGRTLKQLESYRYRDGTFNSFPFEPETNRSTP